MNELFKLLLKLSISGSIFFLIFYSFSFFTQIFFSAKWHFNAIKINIIFFIFPIVTFFDFFTNDIKHNINSNKVTIMFNEIVNSPYSFKISKYLFFIWILGVIVISVSKVYCYKRFLKAISMSTFIDKDLENIIFKSQNSLNINSYIKVRRSTNIATPMIIGILRPTIIFPKDMVITPNLEPIIIHELIHFKRRDLFFKAVQLVIITVHWYNPLVYIMNSSFEKWCEISCDEVVSKDMCYQKRKEYGETILNIIEKSALSENNICFYLCNDTKYIKRRLLMMLNNKKDSKSKKIIGLILISTIFIISAKFSIATTTSNTNLNGITETLDINLVGKTLEESISILEKNGLSIKIESKDEGIERLLESEASKIEKDYASSKYKQVSIIVVDPETNEQLGSCIVK